MAQDSNSDVDRAMAMFGAARVQYRNFVATSVAEVQTSQAAAKQASEHAVTAWQPVDASVATSFPLLIAALPEIIHFPVPHASTVKNLTPDMPPKPAIEPNKAELVKSAARTPITQPAHLAPAPERIVLQAEPTSSAVSDLPLPRGLATRTLKQPTSAPPVTGSLTTPLTAMFRGMHPAIPPLKERSGGRSKLKDILSRL